MHCGAHTAVEGRAWLQTNGDFIYSSQRRVYKSWSHPWDLNHCSQKGVRAFGSWNCSHGDAYTGNVISRLCEDGCQRCSPVVDCLPSMLNAWNSNQSTGKEKMKRTLRDVFALYVLSLQRKTQVANGFAGSFWSGQRHFKLTMKNWSSPLLSKQK